MMAAIDRFTLRGAGRLDVTLPPATALPVETCRAPPIRDSTASISGAACVPPPIRRLASFGCPARPTFAVGGAYFEIQDEDEYQRTVNALRSAQALRSGSA
jgi:hypothetical protein